MRYLLDAAIIACAVTAMWRIVAPLTVPNGDQHHVRTVQPGGSLQLPDVRWEKAARTVVIFISTTCPACLESASFYRAMSAVTKAASGLRFLVLSSESKDVVDAWLARNEIHPHESVSMREDPLIAGLFLTPTLLIVDDAGIIRDVVIGKLGPNQEQHLWARLERPSETDRLDDSFASSEIGRDELNRLIASQATTLLDVREREAYELDPGEPTAINIPVNELPVRARIELSGSAPLVIDCSAGSIAVCRAAGMVLRDLGFSRVFLFSPYWAPAQARETASTRGVDVSESKASIQADFIDVQRVVSR